MRKFWVFWWLKIVVLTMAFYSMRNSITLWSQSQLKYAYIQIDKKTYRKDRYLKNYKWFKFYIWRYKLFLYEHIFIYYIWKIKNHVAWILWSVFSELLNSIIIFYVKMCKKMKINTKEKRQSLLVTFTYGLLVNMLVKLKKNNRWNLVWYPVSLPG